MTASATRPTIPISRRDLLRGAGTAAGAVAGVSVLGACSGGSPEAEENASALASATPGTVVIAVADVPVGGAASATIDGQPVLVTQPTEGELHAFSAICTHQGCDVAPGDGELRCPCHQSRYSLTDASVLGGPAPDPLPEVSITVVDGDVVVS
jgi:cytochrome b6-f complex iron-sulfur subunit